MSIQTSFSNSIYKAYRDLATFGPMESAMYERYTDINQKDKEKDKEKIVNKRMTTGIIILIILIILILLFLGFNFYSD